MISDSTLNRRYAYVRRISETGSHPRVASTCSVKKCGGMLCGMYASTQNETSKRRPPGLRLLLITLDSDLRQCLHNANNQPLLTGAASGSTLLLPSWNPSSWQLGNCQTSTLSFQFLDIAFTIDAFQVINNLDTFEAFAYVLKIQKRRTSFPTIPTIGFQKACPILEIRCVHSPSPFSHESCFP
ncbi:hypothetical protein BC832DRAFT_348216 [Gaertneriomyces semiglobifer]|nr:hypothetical protein BC832DRAFT_348216 [Gaertneriomyces semiglobifer]